MNQGQGSIARTNKVDTVVVPPATVTGADNGLTLLGTIVELGGPLIKGTQVDAAGFVLAFVNTPDNFITLNGATNQIIIGTSTNWQQQITPANSTVKFDYNFQNFLLLDAANSIYEMGDIAGVGNGMMLDISDAGRYVSIGDVNTVISGTVLEVNDNLQLLNFQVGAGAYLYFDVANQLYQMGDVSATGNLTKIDIKDASQAIELDAGTSPARLTLVGNPGTESLAVDFAASPYFSLNPNTGNYFMGDLGGVNNTTTLTLADSVSQAAISSLGFTMLFLDMANGIFQLGASAGGSPNLTYLQVNDAAKSFTTHSGGIMNGLNVDLNNFSFGFGDFAASSNGTQIIINDIISNVNIASSAGLMLTLNKFNGTYKIGAISSGNFTRMEIDDTASNIALFAPLGVGINIIPTASPFAVTGLPAFANNAAAAGAGLAVGDFYRISVAGTSAVAVVQ